MENVSEPKSRPDMVIPCGISKIIIAQGVDAMKQIKGTNYYVTTCGRIINSRGKILNRWIDSVGYYQSILHIDGKRKYIRIHRVLAQCFLEPIKDKPLVNHKNGVKTDTYLWNLEYVDNSTNTQHGYDKGLYKFKRRSYPVIATDKNGNSYEFKSIRECSKELHVNRKTLSRILNKEKKNNYDYDFRYKCTD